MEALGLNLGYLIVQILNFTVIFLVLRAWVFKPVLGMLEKRRQAVAQGLEDARIAAEARENAEQAANKIISEAQKKAAEIVRESTERAEVSIQQMQKDAEAQVNKSRETARLDVEKERDRMLKELRSQVVTLAIAAAQKLIGDSLLQDKTRQQALVQEFFSGIKGGKVVILEESDIKLQGQQTVNITSALPLSTEEEDVIRKGFLTNAGIGAKELDFTFNVDPSILGGLVIRVGDRIVDGSVSGQLEEMRRNL